MQEGTWLCLIHSVKRKETQEELHRVPCEQAQPTEASGQHSNTPRKKSMPREKPSEQHTFWHTAGGEHLTQLRGGGETVQEKEMGKQL